MHKHTFHYLTSQIFFFMNELINRLMQEAGLSAEQAQKAIETIAGFVKEKFPMLGGAVDQVFSAGSSNED